MCALALRNRPYPMIAITREISTALARCELTHLERAPIHLERARTQHSAYERALEDSGCRIIRLPSSDEFPDCVFVEDAAVAFDEVAIMTRPGAASRRGELTAIEEALAPLRPLQRIQAPGTLDGGDVLVLGRSVFVGLSSRSNAEGVRQLAEHLTPLGYSVRGIEVAGCLHLKSAATAIDAGRALVHPGWVSPSLLGDVECIPIDPAEPMAANLVALPGERWLYGAAYPRTTKRLRDLGLDIVELEADELAKAEGALSCCSILLREGTAARHS